MFAIVILNYNSSGDVIKLISQIEVLDATIIVVDNNSTDGSQYNLSKEFLERKNVVFIQSESNNGYAIGNNLGLKVAESMGMQYAFVINPDVSIKNLDVFRVCINTIEDTDSLACAPLIDGVIPFYNRPKLIDLLIPPMIRLRDRSLHLKMLSNGVDAVDVYKLYGCFVCFDIQKFKQIDFFDERTFLYFEESIVAEKAVGKGLRQINILNINVQHVAQSSVKQLGLRQFKFFHNSCLVYLTQFRNIKYPYALVLSIVDVSFRFVVNKLRGTGNG